MIYVDTSAWIALQLREPKTEAVQAWVEAHGMAGLACAEWVKTEYASALSIKRRRGDINDDHFERAHRTFGKICVAGPTWLAALENRKVDVALTAPPVPETAISRGFAIMFINNAKGEAAESTPESRPINKPLAPRSGRPANGA